MFERVLNTSLKPKSLFALVYQYPENIFLFKVTNRTLEKGLEYVQSW